MTRIASTFILMMAALGLAGCNSEPTHDSVAQESAETMEALAATMKSITDEASANAARPKLKEQATRFKELQQQEKSLADATKDQQDELKKKYEDRNEKALKEMLTESMRIRADPRISNVLDDMKLNEPVPQ